MIKNVESMYQDSSSFVTNPIYIAFECGVIVDHHGCSEDFTRTSAGQITNNFTFFLLHVNNIHSIAIVVSIKES